MKKFLLAALAALAIAGCGETAKTPEEVALQFATAIDKGDCKTAKTLCTAGVLPMIEKLETFLAAETPDVQNLKAEMGKGKFEKATCEGTDDKKTCTVCCGSEGQSGPLELVKEDGKWKVDLQKESEMGGEDPSEAPPAVEFQPEPDEE